MTLSSIDLANFHIVGDDILDGASAAVLVWQDERVRLAIQRDEVTSASSPAFGRMYAALNHVEMLQGLMDDQTMPQWEV